MVKKKSKIVYDVYLYNDNSNSFVYVQQLLMIMFGWDVTQSINCVTIADQKGKCLLKSYNCIDDAMYVADTLASKGLTVDIVENEE